MNIRRANENDPLLLAELGRKTFYETFADQNTPEDMALYLSENFSADIQTAEMKDPNTTFLIAEIDAVPVGYVKLNAHNRDDGVTAEKPMELQRIYILQECIGKGVGAELMKASIKEAKEMEFDCLWLGVWEKNEHAIKFYKKWGFKEVGNHLFVLGKEQQNDLIMELSL
jgi:ribosomal protein S18 acetylase RimI-like enzyme